MIFNVSDRGLGATPGVSAHGKSGCLKVLRPENEKKNCVCQSRDLKGTESF